MPHLFRSKHSYETWQVCFPTSDYLGTGLNANFLTQLNHRKFLKLASKMSDAKESIRRPAFLCGFENFHLRKKTPAKFPCIKKHYVSTRSHRITSQKIIMCKYSPGGKGRSTCYYYFKRSWLRGSTRSKQEV